MTFDEWWATMVPHPVFSVARPWCKAVWHERDKEVARLEKKLSRARKFLTILQTQSMDDQDLNNLMEVLNED